MKKIVILSAFMILSNLLFAQMTYIADSNFEQALIDLGYDSTALDHYVITSKIKDVTTLEIKDKNISDLTGIEDFSSLTKLDCSNNNLTSLNLSGNVLLTDLTCPNNQLTSLDISQNISLTRLWCVSNQLSSLDISQNKALGDVVCAANQLTNFDVSQNTSLSFLDVSGNQLSSFVGGNNPSLNSLNCGFNRLTSLDISQNTSLTSLYCTSNQLTGIDLSHNTALVTLFCFSNPLTSIDVSQNTSLKWLICGDKITSLDLSNNIALTDLDCATNPLKSLDVSHNISLENLKCDKTELTSLDVSQNIALKTLFCSSNQIDGLDVTKNVNLTDLNCEGNGMTNLTLNPDKVLNYLYCAGNKLTFESLETIVESAPSADSKQSHLSSEIVTTRNALLQRQIPLLDFSKMDEFYNRISNSFYASSKTNPFILNAPQTGSDKFHYAPQDSIGQKQLNYKKTGESIDYNLVVGGKYNLYQWYKNDISLPSQTSSELNLTNLSKTDEGNYNLYVTNTKLPDLTIFSRPMTLKIEGPTGNNDPPVIIINPIVNDSISGKLTYIADSNFEQALIDLGYDSTALDHYVATSKIYYITTLEIKDKNISDLTGIEDFHALASLDCSNNNLTSLNVSHNVLLMNLICGNNQLTSLDISNNPNLSWLWCNSNQLSDLDVGNNHALNALWCYSNQLTSLNITKNASLTNLWISDNRLSSIDLSQNTGLTTLFVDGNLLSSLDCGNNPNLSSINCGGNKLTSIDISQSTSLTSLYCAGNQLVNIDVSHNTSLVILMCHFNLLTSLDVSQNTSLKQLICNADGNQITSLDLSNNLALTEIDCTANPLKTLDVSHNLSLEKLKCDKTELTSLDVSQNLALTYLFCSSNQIDSLDVTKNVNLTDLSCEGNGMTKLNLINDKVFNYLDCANNRLTFESLEIIVESLSATDSTQSHLSTAIVTTKNAILQKQIPLLDFKNLSRTDEFYSRFYSMNYKNTGNLEYFKSANTGGEMFKYAPQDTLGQRQIISKKVGENFNYNLHVGGKYSLYQWYKNGIAIPTQISESLNLTNVSKTDVGKYTLNVTNTKLTDLTIISFPITLKVDLNTGYNDLTDNHFAFYPNPTKDKLIISMEQDGFVMIYDLNGKVVLEKYLFKGKGEIDVSKFESGNYVIKLNSEKINYSSKFVKI